MTTVIGIDVGGSRNGFHAVALLLPDGQDDPRDLADVQVERTHDCDAKEILRWCQARSPRAIGFDAPCGWSADQNSRACELALHKLGIHSFFTPMRETCKGNPFYEWVFNGERLCQALAQHFPLFQGGAVPELPFSFETFPHAVARSLDRHPQTKETKTARRRRLLKEHNLDLTRLTNGDYRDAALCALTALYMLTDRFTAYGDCREGILVTPHP